MTCRHKRGDPACSSSPEGARRIAEENVRYAAQAAQKKQQELLDRTPDPNVYEVVKVIAVGSWLVLMAQYTSCKKCSFDAKKIMVFENTTMQDVIYWRRIDPHFAKPRSFPPHSATANSDKKQAPPPRARFPGDDQGWEDALYYAKRKSRGE